MIFFLLQIISPFIVVGWQLLCGLCLRLVAKLCLRLIAKLCLTKLNELNIVVIVVSLMFK